MTHLEKYNRIIESRKSNPLPEEQYGEDHHIVPKSICHILKDTKDNIVRLSAQEHFLAHYHLWLAYRDELHEKKWAKKMCYAFHRMKHQLMKCDDIEEMAKLYEEVRIEFSKVHSESLKGHHSWSKGKPSPWKGKRPTDESRKKMSDARKGKSPWNKGKHNIYSEEVRKSMGLCGDKNPNFGTHHTEESKRKISKSKSGEKHHFFGKHLSEEHRRKLSEALKGKPKK